MPIISKGVEVNEAGEVVPGAVQTGRRTGIANQGRGVPTVPVTTDIDYGIIHLTATQGFPRNNAGNPITYYDIGTTDPVFTQVIACLYPSNGTDDNDIQWEVPIPQDMDLTDPQISLILHFLIPEAPFTPAVIPGGLPVGCEGSFIMYISGAWTPVLFTVDNSGLIVTDNTGLPVVSPC